MELLRFSGVACDRITGLSFALRRGEARQLALVAREEIQVVLELAAGERSPERGEVMFEGAPLLDAAAGAIAWLPEHGGLISNLKVWENVTLPLWYHRRHRVGGVEERARFWLAALGLPEGEMTSFMASHAGRLNGVERRQAGLLRCLLLQPRLIVLDAGLFSGIPEGLRSAWLAALETHVRENGDSGILAVGQGDRALPWERVHER